MATQSDRISRLEGIIEAILERLSSIDNRINALDNRFNTLDNFVKGKAVAFTPRIAIFLSIEHRLPVRWTAGTAI